MTNIQIRYSEHYSKENLQQLYPVEFVVRAFLGTYPMLKMDRSRFAGSNVLDLGFGDGRNMPLFHNLGFQIYGVEIHEEIKRSVHERLTKLGIDADLRVGANATIPFDNDFFDFLVACHSCYYVEDGTTFADNLTEIHRVMKTKGIFVCSLPMRDTYILNDAQAMEHGHWRIKQDPYGLRAGSVFRAFEHADEITAEFDPYFSNLKIGFCDDLFWGIRQKVWIVVCEKR